MALNDSGVKSAEELHAFANYLSNTGARLTELMTQTVRELDRVNQGWNDVKQAEFTERFQRSLDKVADLIDLMEEHSKYVHFKGRQIDDYVNS